MLYNLYNLSNYKTNDRNQLEDLLSDFFTYLQRKKLSPISIKNYLSDVRQFLAKHGVKDLTPSVFSAYRKQLLNNNAPLPTINRHLSSLRSFGKFLKEEKLLMTNPARQLDNLQKGFYFSSTLVKEFKISLLKSRLTPATVKNYISDVEHFLGWMKRREEVIEGLSDEGTE